jgi:hypothetical protein
MLEAEGNLGGHQIPQLDEPSVITPHYHAFRGLPLQRTPCSAPVLEAGRRADFQRRPELSVHRSEKNREQVTSLCWFQNKSLGNSIVEGDVPYPGVLIKLRCGLRRAIVAVARKLAIVMHRI